MYHYTYLIENLINGKIYVGKHSTENLEDGYMGSGTLITRAIAKHGVVNFCKHILQYFDTSEDAFAAEKELVTEEFVRNQNTYNITVGGGSGWWVINNDVVRRIEKNRRAMQIANKTIWKDAGFRQRKSIETSDRNRKLHAEGVLKRPDWTGKKHKDESKAKIGAANAIRQLGEKNSQFGTIWVSHLELQKSQRIKKEECDIYLSQGWIIGRKMKW